MSPAQAQRAPLDADAVHVVTNPDLYHSRPLLLRLAWARLKTCRGLHMAQARLSRQPVEVAND